MSETLATDWLVDFCKVTGLSVPDLYDLTIHDGSTVAHVFQGLFLWSEPDNIEKHRLALGRFVPSFLNKTSSLKVGGVILEYDACTEGRTMLLDLVSEA